MGIWGTAIFSDDFASDLRDEFKDLIGDGLTSEQATDRLKKQYSSALRDAEEGPVFWLALAATQWSLGGLIPEVRQNALQLIESGEDLKRWADDRTLHKKRSAVLQALKAKLNSNQPTAKKVKPRFIDSTSWRVKQIIAYKLIAGDYCLFRVIGFHKDQGGTAPVVELLDWRGSDVPDRRSLKKLRIRIEDGPSKDSQFLLGSLSEKELPIERVQSLNLFLRPSQKPRGYTVMLWRHLDQYLDKTFGF